MPEDVAAQLVGFAVLPDGTLLCQHIAVPQLFQNLHDVVPFLQARDNTTFFLESPAEIYVAKRIKLYD